MAEIILQKKEGKKEKGKMEVVTQYSYNIYLYDIKTDCKDVCMEVNRPSCISLHSIIANNIVLVIHRL